MQRAVADLQAIMECDEIENNTWYQVYGMSLVNVFKWNIFKSYRKQPKTVLVRSTNC